MRGLCSEECRVLLIVLPLETFLETFWTPGDILGDISIQLTETSLKINSYLGGNPGGILIRWKMTTSKIPNSYLRKDFRVPRGDIFGDIS